MPFKIKQKAFFIIFEGLSLMQNFLEGECSTLRTVTLIPSQPK